MNQPDKPQSAGALRIPALILALAAIVAAAVGISQRMHNQSALAAEARQSTLLHVGTTHPQPETDAPDLILPGTMQSWVESPVYARATGYVKTWHTDIGAQVRTGQVLAELDTPDLDQQVAQARADVASAQSALHLAQITAQRWQKLVVTKTVSQQDADTKTDAALASQAALDAAQANLDRLLQLDRYKFITSPINGIVTSRNLDIGQLIDIGSGNGAARELFHVAETDRMRVYVAVPETEARLIKPGMKVQLALRSEPGKTRTAIVSSTAGAIDQTSHTLLAELQIDNRDGSLLPGGFVEARFHRKPDPALLDIPSNALIFNAHGTFVASVTSDGIIRLNPVVPGRDFGRHMEILHGLSPDMNIVVSPPDSIHDGEKVIAGALQGMHS